jgi:hypothetical protein
MFSATAKPVALLVALATIVALGVTSLGTAEAGQPAAAGAERAVAHNGHGSLTSRIAGETGNGRTVTGSFSPLDFRRANGKVVVRGLLSGVVHNTDGSTSTFSTMRTLKVKRINGQPATTAAGAGAVARGAACDILNLVLAPLDLDLLGLRVHLDRVRLIVDAVAGAGNLLGNLLCAVVGLLDGGLGGQLGRLSRLLDRILAVLRVGV